MNKLARILLVEPEPGLRRDLDRHLERAGHEVTAVADPDSARGLVLEGLLPDVVLTDGNAIDVERVLRDVLPDAMYLRIVRDAAEAGTSGDAVADPASCPPDPSAILRRIEEALVRHAPRPSADEAASCLDLARRLASSLPRTRTASDRIERIIDGFDAYYGVTGTLVVRRGPGETWVEVRQGLDVQLAERVSSEIARRTQHRGLRPFLTGVESGGAVQPVACVAVASGDVETDLAMALRSAPASPAHRESLMNLVGSALRSAMAEEAAEDTRALLEAQVSSFESLLAMSRRLLEAGGRDELCEAVLRALQRELGMTRSALFLCRERGGGMLDLQSTRGFAPGLLDRIGLSAFHGVGAECLAVQGPRRLATIRTEGVAVRELGLLSAASLRWAAPFQVGPEARGIVFFGCPDDGDDLAASDRQILHALLAAASVALQGLERFESLRDLSARSVRTLVSALEMQNPADRGHADRVARLAVRVGRALGLAADELRDLAFAALLHDVGKVAFVPESAPASPSAEERRRRAHPVVGSRILAHARPSPAVIQAVEQHHERWDGLGYPYGLRATGIQKHARIVAIADAYDRLRGRPELADRPDDALLGLERGAGLRWDPGLVAVFASEIARVEDADAPPDRDDWLETVLAGS